MCIFILGFSKAYDSVDKKNSLKKSECYGIRGDVHLLLRSYLDGRKLFVSFRGYELTCKKWSWIKLEVCLYIQKKIGKYKSLKVKSVKKVKTYYYKDKYL